MSLQFEYLPGRTLDMDDFQMQSDEVKDLVRQKIHENYEKRASVERSPQFRALTKRLSKIDMAIKKLNSERDDVRVKMLELYATSHPHAKGMK